MTSQAQVADVASSRPVVEAFVRSAGGPPGQPGADEIGDEDHRGCIRDRGFGLRRELVERVERQELQARARVETVRRHDAWTRSTPRAVRSSR